MGGLGVQGMCPTNCVTHDGCFFVCTYTSRVGRIFRFFLALWVVCFGSCILILVEVMGRFQILSVTQFVGVGNKQDPHTQDIFYSDGV